MSPGHPTLKGRHNTGHKLPEDTDHWGLSQNLYTISLYFNFLMCQMGMILTPTLPYCLFVFIYIKSFKECLTHNKCLINVRYCFQRVVFIYFFFTILLLCAVRHSSCFLSILCTHQSKEGRQYTKVWESKLPSISTTQTRIQLSPPHAIINLTTLECQFKWEKKRLSG